MLQTFTPAVLASIALGLTAIGVLSTLEDKGPNKSSKITCPICLENEIDVILSCGHGLCSECSIKSNKECPTCERPIQSSIHVQVPVLNTKRYKKLLDMKMKCPKCLKYDSTIILNCGHELCLDCAIGITDCPFCKFPITKKQPIYYEKYLKYKQKYLELKKSRNTTV